MVFTNFPCRLVFPNVAQRKIRFSKNFSCRLVLPNGLILSIPEKQSFKFIPYSMDLFSCLLSMIVIAIAN